MNWWDILKSAKVSSKVSSKGKGTSFDATKIKINVKDDESCVEKFNKIYKYIEDEIQRIWNSTSLSSDVETYGKNEGNGWIWFAFTDKDLRDATNDNNETYKALVELEYTNYRAKDEEAACKQLKILSEKYPKFQKDDLVKDDGFYWGRRINNLTFVGSLAEDKGGLIQMHYSIINPKVHKYYRKSVQMKPSLKAELRKLGDSIDNLFTTVHQMAKDAVREKGL